MSQSTCFYSAIKLACVLLPLVWAGAVCANDRVINSSDINVAANSTATKKIEVTDYLGRNLLFDKPVERVIALAPHIVENVYSAGGGETLVGAVDYSDYPASAKDLVRVGAISSFSLEAIVSLKPDLVMVWHSGRGANVMEKLEEIGIPTYASDPHSLMDVARSIRDYGTLTGNEEIAEESANTYELKYRSLAALYQESEAVSVLYEVWNQPLQTLNNKHIISDVIRLCGGVNLFGDEPSLAPVISVESVLQRNPDVIIASGMGEEKPEWLDDWYAWPQLKAVKTKNLYFISPDLLQRHTARILDGAEIMCSQLEAARVKLN